MKNNSVSNSETDSRRSFIRKMSAGAAGMAFGTFFRPKRSPALFGRKKSLVTLVPGTDQREATYKSLKPLEKDILKAIGDRQVVIKANAGVTFPKAINCSTDVNQLRGILDFLVPIYDKQIIVAEGIATPALSAFVSYENYNYLPLKKEYNVKFIDLNDQPTTTKWIREGIHRPRPVNIINTFFDPDVYIISATRLKTHNAVLVTLSLKNVVMGSPVCHYKWKNKESRNEKSFMHGGRGQMSGRELSYNLFLVANMGVQPDLAVLDGVVGAEGDGPWGATSIEGGIALASTDWLAADRLGIELMGVDYKEIKYLNWCGKAGMGEDDLSKIKIIGPDYKRYVLKYKLSRNADKQREWIYENDLYGK